MKDQFTKERLTFLVELAWEVANGAKSISPNPMIMKNEEGVITFDSVRWQTYQILLGSILPKNNVGVMDATMSEPKEDWQG